MTELSVIIPVCNEFPQVLFTVQSIAQELRDRVDFEIIIINNYCNEVKKQGYPEDKSYEALLASERINPWLKVLHYKDKLSHWQAKNMGVKASTGQFLWFSDAHCIISRDALFHMLKFYKYNYEELNGTLHLPLTYKILESHKTLYKLIYQPEIGTVHYTLTGYRYGKEFNIAQVPCMSSCGCMMTRNFYNEIGGWPKELGIYGGGENFLNFTSAILGKTVNIFCGNQGDPLFHHGEKRGYSYNYDDYTKNRTVATYMFGGKKWAQKYIQHRKGNPEVNRNILNKVLESGREQREMIKTKQVMTIEEWVTKMIEMKLYQPTN